MRLRGSLPGVRPEPDLRVITRMVQRELIGGLLDSALGGEGRERHEIMLLSWVGGTGLYHATKPALFANRDSLDVAKRFEATPMVFPVFRAELQRAGRSPLRPALPQLVEVRAQGRELLGMLRGDFDALGRVGSEVEEAVSARTREQHEVAST